MKRKIYSPGSTRPSLAAGDVGLPVGIIAVFHGVGQVGVDLLLGCHLRLGLGQVALGGQNLLAQVQQPGGGADKQGQYHQLGQEGRFFGFTGGTSSRRAASERCSSSISLDISLILYHFRR